MHEQLGELCVRSDQFGSYTHFKLVSSTLNSERGSYKVHEKYLFTVHTFPAWHTTCT